MIDILVHEIMRLVCHGVKSAGAGLHTLIYEDLSPLRDPHCWSGCALDFRLGRKFQ